jgi:Tfp pilus assembly protein PilF
MDPRFAGAHYQLGEIYLKLKGYNQAYAVLSRTVHLAPENYTAHVDLANC